MRTSLVPRYERRLIAATANNREVALDPRSIGDAGAAADGLTSLTDTQVAQGCAGSNVAEMYYALVPDPTGRFSDVRTKADVLNDTPGTHRAATRKRISPDALPAARGCTRDN